MAKKCLISNMGILIAKNLIPKHQFGESPMGDQVNFENGNFEFNIDFFNFERLRHIISLSDGNWHW